MLGSKDSWQPKNFEALPIDLILSEQDKFAYRNDIEKKKAYAIELAKNNKNKFEAALQVFPKDTAAALWVSVNWNENDPIITEAKKEYKEASICGQKVLDKTELSLRLLTFSEETLIFNGETRYAAEAKDRLAALKLFAEIQGFINNKTTEINNNINNKNNFMEIKFVEPEKKENVKIIDHSPSIESENILENSPIKLKLVG